MPKTKQEKKGLKRGTFTRRSIRGLTSCAVYDAERTHRFVCEGKVEDNENIISDLLPIDDAAMRLNVLFTVVGLLKHQRDKFKNTKEFLEYTRSGN